MKQISNYRFIELWILFGKSFTNFQSLFILYLTLKITLSIKIKICQVLKRLS